MKNIITKIPVLTQKINWFPGHMNRALKQIQSKTNQIDIFLEVRDSRLPYSTRNPQFDQIIKRAQKQKIIVFNKFDLCDEKNTLKITGDYNTHGIKCYHMSAKTHQNMKSLLEYIKTQLPLKYSTVGIWMMICGMPNVGKSTIINQIRTVSDLQNKRAIAKATATVCTTKSVSGIKISAQPVCYLIDSPGVMIPSIISDEVGLKLGLLGLLRDIVIDKLVLIQFMITLFENQKNSKYYTAFNLNKPQNHMEYILRVRQKFGFYNYQGAYDYILNSLRQGKFGKITLDIPETGQ